MNKVKFDGKHWIAKRPRNGPFLFHSYKHVAQLASHALGRNGIVAVPNARPTANQPDPEFRYEELLDAANRTTDIIKIDNRKAFFDPNFNIYFMKAQEIRTDFSGDSVVFLVYNLPYGKNLEANNGEQVLEDAVENNCIIGVTVPSCIKTLEKALDKKPDLLHYLDFVIIQSGIEALRGNNPPSLAFYDKHIEQKTFTYPYSGEPHSIGGLYVSGGHRTPKSFIGRLLNGFQQTLGSSDSLIAEPSSDNFMKDMRQNIQNTKKENGHLILIRAEALRHKASLTIEKYLGGHPHFK